MTEIPSNCLRDGTFSELDLSGVPGVTAVGHSFLRCTSLHTADLSGWSNVTLLEGFFLYSCSALTTLDLSGWNNVTQLGNSFLRECSALKTLDLSGLATVQHIREDFLYGCNIPTSSINVTGSSSVVSEYVNIAVASWTIPSTNVCACEVCASFERLGAHCDVQRTNFTLHVALCPYQN